MDFESSKNIFNLLNSDQDEMEIEDEQDDNDDLDNQEFNESDNQKSSLEPKSMTIVEAFAKKSKFNREYLQNLSMIGQLVLANPQKNIHRLKTLLNMLDIGSDHPDYGLTFYSIQKMTFLTLNVIFMDILPNYRINALRENKSQLKAETKDILNFEQKILHSYKEYLKRLKRVIFTDLQRKRGGGSDFYSKMLTRPQARQRLSLIGVRSICELLVGHFDFNCRQDLLDIVTRILVLNQSHNNVCLSQMKQSICDSLQTLFKKDFLGECTAEFVQLLCQRIVEVKFHVEPITMKVFESIMFREISRDDKQINVNQKRKFRRQLSRKERKSMKKQIRLLERQLRETDATENEDTRAKHERDIHGQLYAFYMKFIDVLEEHLSGMENGNLKESASNRIIDLDRWYCPMLSNVLKGIHHLSIYSNKEFAIAWIHRLKLLMNLTRFEQDIRSNDKLLFLRQVYSLIKQLGLKSDQLQFEHLYQMFYNFKLDQNCMISDNFRLFLQCSDMMITENVRYLPNNYLEHFAYKFSSLALMQITMLEILPLLFLIRKCLQNISIGYFTEDDDEDDWNFKAQNESDNDDRLEPKKAKNQNQLKQLKDWNVDSLDSLNSTIMGHALIVRHSFQSRTKILQKNLVSNLNVLANKHLNGYVRFYSTMISWNNLKVDSNHHGSDEATINAIIINKLKLEKEDCWKMWRFQTCSVELYDWLRTMNVDT